MPIPQLTDLLAATRRASFGHLAGIATLMTNQSPARAMKREWHIIPRAAHHKATVATKDVSRTAFAIQEEDSLLTRVQSSG